MQIKRRLGGLALTAGLALFAVPAASQAAVDLGTAQPFVVLGGQTATNTGTSVLNGDLGVSPGEALPGFNEAVLNGATHANDAVAAQAQLDLTTANEVAAGEPVLPANNLTDTNLGERTLTAGNYEYTSSAQLTGALILDAQGDPDAQFVFEITAELTTAPASSVLLVNGASPCNVYWQVGSSATLDTTTTFVGSLMALTSISLNNGASVNGRMLARNGQVSLDDNVLTRPLCAGDTDNPPDSPPGGPTPPGGNPGTPGQPATGNESGAEGNPTQGSGINNPRARRSARRGTAVTRTAPRGACTEGFRATVRGKRIERVVFSLDGARVSNLTNSPFTVSIKAAPGKHSVRARVTFTDATRAKTMAMPYRACAAAALRPQRGPSQFTG
jgi:hypothetical protein